jgi:hypothetical protein
MSYAVFGCIESWHGIEFDKDSKSKIEMNCLLIRFYCLDVYGNCIWNQKGVTNSKSCLDVQTMEFDVSLNLAI